MQEHELAYKRKARLRGKNRKVTIEQVYDMDNLIAAEREARKGKGSRRGVRYFDRDRERNLLALQKMLRDRTYHTSEGQECICRSNGDKERLLFKLPYYPDHIVHHALMRVIMPVLRRYYYVDSSASVKGKGMHYAMKRTRRWIDENGKDERLYYAKLDFVKFYHNIRQDVIFEFLCRMFSDSGIRYLLNEVVTACRKGLGIGLYPVLQLVNAYTSPLCRMLMQRNDVRVEIYCDDVLIMSRSKSEVWQAVNDAGRYASDVMCQALHDNIGVQMIDGTRRVDFVGYQFFYGHTLLRKRMKKRFARCMSRLTDARRRYEVATAYKGWLMHCDGYRLWCKVMEIKSFKELNVPKYEKMDDNGKRMLEGTRVSASILKDHEIVFLDAEIGVRSKFPDKQSAVIQVEDNNIRMKFFTCNKKLIQTIQYVKDNGMFPFKGTLVRVNTSGLPDYEIR